GLTIPVRQRTYIMSRVRMLRVRTFSWMGNAMNLKKCAFQMSAPEDDSFEIDDALEADIVATSTLPGVSLTSALVENNKQMFLEVVKVLEQAEPKALKLTSVSDSVTTNGHAKLTESNKVENEKDQKSTNISGKDG
nr:hypothetical protein [Tanacetum cinerariifolium]